MRLAVCISGHIGRLELHTKLSNIVRANAAYGVVAVFVALHVDVPVYLKNATVANDPPPAVSGSPTQCGSAGYASTAQVAEELGPHFGGSWDGKHDPKLEAALRRMSLLAHGRNHTESLLANHLRQLLLWRECALLIEGYEQWEKTQFDMVVRLKDSALVLQPMRIAMSPYYSVRKCHLVHGTADKMAMFNRSVAQTVLRSVPEQLLLQPQREGPLQDAARSSKQLLQHTLRTGNIPVEKKDALPVVDARRCGCAANGNTSFWCPVAPYRDCWPRREGGQGVRSMFTLPYQPLCDVRTRGLNQPKDAEPLQELTWMRPCNYRPGRRLSAGAPRDTSLGAWVLPSDACYFFDVKLAKAIVGLIPASDTLMELGAGTGCYTAAYHHAGIKVLAGIDGADGIDKHTRGWVQQFNLASGVLDAPADWIVCLEVAEHIPKQYESAFVANLVSNARKAIVLSWSDSNRVGSGHVNARTRGQVQALMLSQGFIVNDHLTSELRSAAALRWFRSGITVFQRI